MHKKTIMPPAGEAILAGDLERMRQLTEDGSLLFRKGKTVSLRKDIPETVALDGKELTIYTDAFHFALSNDQMEIVYLLIDCGLVDLGPKGDALFMAIRMKDFTLLNYMLDHGGEFGQEERDVTRLLLNLSDVWDEYCPVLLERLELPLCALGGGALVYAASDNHVSVVEYLLEVGVDVNSRDSLRNTPVLQAAAEGHTDMVRYLVERGADLTAKNEFGLRPYTAARANRHMDTAALIKSLEPVGAFTEEVQDELFDQYKVPTAMRDYFKNGPLLLKFPEEELLGWVRLFAYTDVAEITYNGHRVLSLVEDSEDYNVMLVWEPKSKKVWFIDMEHSIFHPVATWTKFIRQAGRYINRAVMWEFDDFEVIDLTSPAIREKRNGSHWK